MSCGISVPFETLSPTRRQVTHALLTRLPLSYPLRGNRVRLACVRHAASVDSEPGSNSHVRWFASRARPPLRTRTTGTRSDSTNTRPVMALALSPMPTPPMFRKAPTPGLLSSLDDWPRPTTPRSCYLREAIEPDRHPLILDGLAVTFYLVFKEPVLPVHPPPASQPSSGEPFKLTNPRPPCQALISAFPGVPSRPFDVAPFDRGGRRGRSSCVATSTPMELRPWGGRRAASHAHLRHRAWRFLELEGRDARRLRSTWAAVRLPLRARHLAASLTNIRPCDGRVNRQTKKTLLLLQVTEAQGVHRELPAVLDRGQSRAGSGRWPSRLRRP